MVKIFVDINVFIDLYLFRWTEENINSIKNILYHIENKDFIWITSIHTIATLYYVLKNYKISHNDILEYINNIEKVFYIVWWNNETLKRCLNNSSKDFEDGLQYELASESFADYIITNNIKDFKFSEIEVKNPIEFINLFSYNLN